MAAGPSNPTSKDPARHDEAAPAPDQAAPAPADSSHDPTEPVDTPARASLMVGQAAPDFALQGDDGRWFRTQDLLGQRFVLYFYPRNNTPACTAEAGDFRDALSQFATLGVSVLGVSGDSLKSHQRFREQHGLNFPLLSDPGSATAAAFGAFGKKSVGARKVMGTIRSTFVVGPEGDIEHAYHGVRVAGHVAAVLKDLNA